LSTKTSLPAAGSVRKVNTSASAARRWATTDRAPAALGVVDQLGVGRSGGGQVAAAVVVAEEVLELAAEVVSQTCAWRGRYSGRSGTRPGPGATDSAARAHRRSARHQGGQLLFAVDQDPPGTDIAQQVAITAQGSATVAPSSRASTR
jgi:hypothetical protein